MWFEEGHMECVVYPHGCWEVKAVGGGGDDGGDGKGSHEARLEFA